MKTGYKSDAGRNRNSNEDSFFVDPDQGIYVVADGMGGHKAGEVASGMAVEVVREALKKENSSFADRETVQTSLIEAFFSANEKIRVTADKDMNLQGMGTTLVTAIHFNDDIYISHVGDSRAYLVRQGAIRQLTEDHSVVAQMVKAGKITSADALTHHLKHMISQAVGISEYLAPSFESLKLGKRDFILLCTDGLTDMLTDQEILSAILECKDDPQQGCDSLIDAANAKGGKDNITAVLLYNAD